MRAYFTFLCFILILSCKNGNETTASEDSKADLNTLYSLMQGSFNSEIQAQQDSSYYNISLHMYPIWKDRGNFLYVEQALNSMQDRPYRQRIYEVTQQNDSIFSSAVYTLPNDSLYIGKYNDPSAFDHLTTDSLELRKGCAVLLKKIGPNHFKGSTDDMACESSLRGASYATSEVEITATEIRSWDRGFDAEGNHVWGAEKGGYVFNKLQE